MNGLGKIQLDRARRRSYLMLVIRRTQQRDTLNFCQVPPLFRCSRVRNQLGYPPTESATAANKKGGLAMSIRAQTVPDSGIRPWGTPPSAPARIEPTFFTRPVSCMNLHENARSQPKRGFLPAHLNT